MKKFISQPSELNCLLPFCVAVFDVNKNAYTPMKGEEYATEQEAMQRADELNKEYEKECLENN